MRPNENEITGWLLKEKKMSSLFQRIKEIESVEATPCNQSELIEPLEARKRI